MGNKQSAEKMAPTGQENSPDSNAGAAACPVLEKQPETKKASNTSACPIPGVGGASSNKGSTVYDVYGQKVDPKNMMPSTPNQLPAPGQERVLPTDREVSSIPKGGADKEESWVYPSEQMFYNALKRKGKVDENVSEEDMKVVVQIHNSMNERTWGMLLDWEKQFHCDACPNPKLARFQGRPDDYSPSAYFYRLLGYPWPFDRHDWVIDRCGEEVRYVVDYYSNESNVGDSVDIDLRPALDSLSSARDRSARFLNQLNDSVRGALSSATSGASVDTRVLEKVERAIKFAKAEESPRDEKEFEFLSKLTGDQVRGISMDIKSKCLPAAQAIDAAAESGDSNAQEQASVGMNYCIGQAVCSDPSSIFMKAMENGSSEEIALAYHGMTSCIERFHLMAKRVLRDEANDHRLGPEQR